MNAEQATLLLHGWSQTWQDLQLPAPAGVYAALLASYAEPHRHYHSLQHLAECLSQFETLRPWCAQPGAVALALWFHDAIYDPQARDNEASSAEWAAAVLRGAGAEAGLVGTVHGLIMATAHACLPVSRDEKILVDIDLSILAADAARYAEYERQIRAEYQHVPAEAFRAGRRHVLESFLQRPLIYACAGLSPDFAAREAQARRNLQDSLARLAAQAPT